MGFAAFRECIAIEQQRLIDQPYRRPTTSPAPDWRRWVVQRPGAR